MAQQVVDQIKLLFGSEPRHVFEKIAGQGGSGIALCFQDKEAEPHGFSRFIIKTVVLGNDVELTNETRWLERLQWAEHIVAPIKLNPDPLAGLFEKPYLIIEYLENGTLNNFLVKRRAAGLGRLPNRVLWAIFLCLARACVAMANPPPPIPDPRTPKDKRRETLPVDANTRAPYNLIHSDMNLGNLMFGDGEERIVPSEQPPNTEHHLAPILKLIDFGDANEVTAPEEEPRIRVYDRSLNLVIRMENDVRKLRDIGKPVDDGRDKFRNVATDMNILEIGVVMGRLVTNDLTNPRAGVLRELMLELHDDMANTNLDNDLFWLVARCLACNPFLRPRLSHLLDLLEYYTANKTYRAAAEESDLHIRQMIQRYIFDADRGGAAYGAIILSEDSVAADVPRENPGNDPDNPDDPINPDPSVSVAEVSEVSIEGDINHPITISSGSSRDGSIGSVGRSIANPIVIGSSGAPSPQNPPSQGGSANNPIIIE